MDKQAIDTILANSAATLIQRDGDGKPFVIANENYRAIDVEKFLETPVRTIGNITVTTEASFLAYFSRFALPNSAVFFDDKNHNIIGIIDYDAPDKPAWSDHKVGYNCPLYTEWKTWQQNDRKKMNQEDFAEFIENNMRDFVNPNGATMLEIATKFKVIRKASFGSSIRLASGEVQFQFSEENQKGTIEIPETFSLGLAPFKSGQKYSLDARLRYRVREGTLVLWYELIDAEQVIDDAFANIADNVKKSVGENTLTVFATSTK